MSKLSHSDYSRLLDFIAELQEPIAIKDFGTMIVRQVSSLFPGATIAFDQINQRSGEYSGFDHNVELDAAEQAKMQLRLQEVYQQNPIYEFIQSGANRQIVDLDELMAKRDFRRTDFYQDIFRPYGINHQVSVLLCREGWINTLTLNHARPISGKTKAMLALSSRHIQIAHQIAYQKSQLARAPEPVIASLTPREQEVFHWLSGGKRNSEIAIILGIAVRTVEKHVENILCKTGTENRCSAAARW